MRGITGGLIGMMVLAGAAAAEDLSAWHEVAGHEIALIATDDATQRLEVDGVALHEDGLILLDEVPVTVAGVTVLTGSAGSGGNACNAAPFVLVLPQGGPVRLDGPLDSCAWMERKVQPDALVFASEALPGAAGEVWTWTPMGGFAEAQPETFAPEAGQGWEAMAGLAGAHPVEALKLTPVYAALQAGLGASWGEFAERIEGLGSGDLGADGYRGEACLKFTCDSDFAILWLDRAGQGVYAYWRVDGKGWVWPADTKTWPQWISTDLEVALQR